MADCSDTHIVSLYIYHFSTVVDFSSEKYSGSTGHTGTPGTSGEIYSDDANEIYSEDASSTSWMGSQPQLSEIMMEYTNWINSTPSQQ